MSYSKTITVSYYENSYAQTYCYENYITKTNPCTRLYGDFNLDGNVNIRDVTLIQMYRAELTSGFGYRGMELGDVNKNNKVDLRDATMIQMYLAQLITDLG